MRGLVGLWLFLLAGAGLQGQSTPAASDLAQRIQARYATVRDFTANFTLAQTTGLISGNAVDRGTVKIKKPNQMRWVFETGNKSEVVADGIQIYSYFPKDKYVQVTPMPKDEQASTALLLLAGRGSLTRDFDPALPANQPAGEWHLMLKPKVRQPDFSTLTLVVDRASLGLRGLLVVDEQGGTQTFRFSNLRENVALRDSEFVFTMPKGVVVRR